jgi:hypothetical protein
VNKKIKENRYKPETAASQNDRTESRSAIDFYLKIIMTVVAISLVSLASIFAYDFITQSNVFNVKEIEIKGLGRASQQDILKLSELKPGDNIFAPNLFATEKKIKSHPWVHSVCVKRRLPSCISITIVEQEPLAIVKIENLADILINKKGRPFKEYNPQTDQLNHLPVITGLDLTAKNNEYQFHGPLFNSIMDFLNTPLISAPIQINGDKNIGINIKAKNFSHSNLSDGADTIEIRLGFNDFQSKLYRAKEISTYIGQHFPDRIIITMDLFNIEKVFVKTKGSDALHNTLEKGV